MDDLIKVLVLDNEDLILETIEMFYPSDDVQFLCANSLSKAFSLIESDAPIIIITNYILNEDSGKSLIDKIKNKTKNSEIILLADINDFKDVLSEFGDVVSDIVYKPLDMDVLETIIKRAKKRYINSIKINEFQKIKEKYSEETNRLNIEIINLNEKIQNTIEQNETLKLNLKNIETEYLHASNSENEIQKGTNKIISELENEIEKEKRLNNIKNEFITSIISFIRRGYQKQSLDELYIIAEETLKKQFQISSIQTICIDLNNIKKISKIDELFTNNKVLLEYDNAIEIPFKISNSYYLFYIPEKINLSSYINYILLFRDTLTVISYNIISKVNYLNQIEKQKLNSKGINSILANIKIYMKQSFASKKIESTKNEITKTANDIMDLIFSSQAELSKIDGEAKDKLNLLSNNLNQIVNDKSQNFDLITQKLVQIEEMINNIEIGLEGQRMKQISGDQYLFSKERILK